MGSSLTHPSLAPLGSTPLHFAAANGHAPIVKILLLQGADPLKADKYGTRPEALSIEFGHDEVTGLIREWIAEHPPMDPSVDGAPAGPPSPSRSRRLQVKRSLENLLTRKTHGMTPAYSSTTVPHSTSTLNIDITTNNATPASSSTETFAGPTLAPSGSRRPSLPQIFERAPVDPAVSPSKKSSPFRPRSAGATEALEGTNPQRAGTLPTLTSLKNKGSKMSLRNIFKRSGDNRSDELTAGLGTGAYNASSPNLAEFLSSPGDLVRSRQRSSIDEMRGPGPSRGSLDRDRTSFPVTAPPQRTSFFGDSPTSKEELEEVGPLPFAMLPRTSRSNSQTRGGLEYRPRADSNATVASTTSSFDAYNLGQPVSGSVGNPSMYNNWARIPRDRSASEGSMALGRASPLVKTWSLEGEGEAMPRASSGALADEEDGSIRSSQRTARPSLDARSSLDAPRSSFSGPVIAPPPRRPSLTKAASGSDASASPHHNRTNSTQSGKNLRFDLSINESPATSPRAVSSSNGPPTQTRASSSPQAGSPPYAHRMPKRPLRSCASAGSLPRANVADATARPATADRSFGKGKAGDPSSSFLDLDEHDHDHDEPRCTACESDDDDCIAAEEAEGGDSVGEPVWTRSPFPRSGSMNGTRPILQGFGSPPTSMVMSPQTTTSSIGRPWTAPESPNGSQSSLNMPGLKASTQTSLSVNGKAGEGTDSRLRGASVSSSKSTDTSTSSANPATVNGGSDSGSQQNFRPSYSTSTSTASVGTTGKAHALRQTKLGPIAISPVVRHAYEIDTYESSPERYAKASPPLPVLIRSVNSHAQAHALVEKAQQDILDLASLPPESASLTPEALSAQLAAYGETLALERRFAKGEAQKNAWIARQEQGDDTDEEELDDGPALPHERKGSFGVHTGASTAPTLHRLGSVEFGGVNGKSKGVGRSKSARVRVQPLKSQTTPVSSTGPVRTTPSNIGPPIADLKNARHSLEDSRNPDIVVHGIEITKTLPTPTDSPLSVMDLAAAQAAGRDIGVDEAEESPGGESSSYQNTALRSSRNPDVMVSEFQPVIPLERVSTSPSPMEKDVPLPDFTPRHGRNMSAGNSVMMGAMFDDASSRSESRMGKRFGGFKNLVQTLKGR